jgi:undecaprenyl-diphosphatase
VKWKSQPLVFDIVVHFATFCAIIVYFRKEWLDILRGAFSNKRTGTSGGSNQGKLFWWIIIASIPGIVFGVIIVDKVEYYFRNALSVALMLGMFGLILYLSELYGRKNKSLVDITWQIALLIGFSQMLAIIPGVSRSGITISAAMALGLNRDSSVRFSFLLGVPIILAAAFYGIKELGGAAQAYSWYVLSSGFIASFISGILAIHFLLKYIKRHPFTLFVIYRLAISAIIVTILFSR